MMSVCIRIVVFVVGISTLFPVRAQAFCSGDSWSGFIANIANAGNFTVTIEARLVMGHLPSHPSCYGEMFAKAQLVGMTANCTQTASRAHYNSGGNDVLVATRNCGVSCGFNYHAGGEFYWNNHEHEEFDESQDRINVPCGGGCQEPPGGCGQEGCVWDPYECACVDCCPLVLDTSGRGYQLTSADRGVWFDINADGKQDAISWTDPSRDVGFLALDRNRNGLIDDGEELFGNVTLLPPGSAVERASNGFEALSALESSAYAPNVRDGVIDARDAAYHDLLLWVDDNHDGASQPGELRKASAAGLMALETKHRESKRRDEFGNEFRLRGISWWQRGGRLDARMFYDVWFVPVR